jgi:23S rRNA pseudouridine1911/1915/1917 synthase
MKVSSRDILAILKRFNIATDDDISRSVEHVTTSNPESYNLLISFRFRRQIFYLLFDDEAEDDPAYILKQIYTSNASALGDVIKNPHEHLTQFALRFKGKDAYLFAIKSTKKRLDVYLGELYPETSRSTWQKHIKAGHILVNGVAETSVKYDVGEGDSIAISLPSATDFSEHELPIVYIDENVIVINKPIGVLTHSKGALNDEFTVADFFRRYTTFGLDTNRPGIVHRLDRDTSGIMIGARNPETAALLQKQFASRLAKKRYIAILDGHVKQHEAIINLPIDRNPNTPSTFRVDAKGKQAVTQYRVLAENGQLSLAELQPRTGRTHQLRVHMEYLGAPIRGDRVYGKAANRLFLHAKSLEITLPSGQRHVFEAPVPAEFIQLFSEAKEF